MLLFYNLSQLRAYSLYHISYAKYLANFSGLKQPYPLQQIIFSDASARDIDKTFLCGYY